MEIQNSLQQCFETVLCTGLYPRSQIDIQLQVLQSDGSQLCACINAATLALADAGIPMNDMLVACSAGVLDRTLVTDLNFLEESSGSPFLPIAVLPRSDRVAMVKMTSKIPVEDLEGLLKQAREGCRQVYEVLQSATRERAMKLLEARRQR
jgi:exosome complex component RRP41